MISKEQDKKIVDYLLMKNLPYDLLLEVRDHMSEQIENSEEKDFEKAFQSAKDSWKKELHMTLSYTINNLNPKTRLQKNIERKNHWQILGKCMAIYAPFVLVMCFIALHNVLIFKTILFSISYLCIVFGIFIFAKNFSILKNTLFVSQNKVSLFQKGAGNMLSGIIFIILYHILLKDQFYLCLESIQKIAKLQFSPSIIAHFLTTFGPVLWFLFGLMYFLQYKNAVSLIKQRINLK